MPRLVVLTKSAVSSMAFPASIQSIILTLGPKMSFKFSARARVRFVNKISGTPASSSAAITALAAPPAPKTNADPTCGVQSGAPVVRFLIKPKPSVLSAFIFPSALKISVLAAPIKVARSVIISTWRMTSSLCGTVTFRPTKPIVGNILRVFSRLLGSICNGI